MRPLKGSARSRTGLTVPNPSPEKPRDLRFDKRFGKTCAYRAPAGYAVKGNPRTEEYEICLSQTQVKKLFPAGMPDAALGGGATAKVWARGADEVTKVTRDAEDVGALLRAQGLPHVVRVKKVFALDRAGFTSRGPTQTYGIVAERLEPIPKDLHYTWIGHAFQKVRKTILMDSVLRLDEKNPQAFRLSPESRALLPRSCDLEYTNADYPHRDACKRFMVELGETFEKLTQRGIYWADIHPGNFGMGRDGKWKILDLGLSETPLPAKPLPVLAGRTGARRR